MKIEIPLLPWQEEFAADIETPELGMLGGLNSGKTWVFCIKAITLAAANADGDQGLTTRGGLFEPTNHLVTTHLVPYLINTMNMMEVDYEYHAGKQIMELKFENGNFPIMLLSAENHERIIAYNWAFAGFEELDTSNFELAQLAYKKGKERVRWGKYRQTFVTTTIEGNKFCQYNYVEDANENKKTIHANTEDNPLADQKWLEDQRQSMSPSEYRVRIQGQWGSILSKRVYQDYTETPYPHGNLTHIDRKSLQPGEAIHCGGDFNTGKCHTVIHKLHEDGAIAIDEISCPKNTDTITYLKTNYRGHPIFFYPDTSGDNANYIGYDTAIAQLRDAGFHVKLNSRKQSTNSEDVKKGSNPFVGDRISAFNAMILNMAGRRRYLVNNKTCPLLHRSLMGQQWVKKGDTEVADKSRDIDHPLDAAGYFVFYNWPIRKKPSLQTV